MKTKDTRFRLPAKELGSSGMGCRRAGRGNYLAIRQPAGAKAGRAWTHSRGIEELPDPDSAAYAETTGGDKAAYCSAHCGGCLIIYGRQEPSIEEGSFLPAYRPDPEIACAGLPVEGVKQRLPGVEQKSRSNNVPERKIRAFRQEREVYCIVGHGGDTENCGA